MMPRISVVIPAFNAAPFIGDTLASVLGQTITELEVIVVDDGSTDGTRQRIDGADDRVRLLHQDRGGAARARNLGVGQARGEWIAFLDADDLWTPDKLERQLDLAAETGSAFVFADRINIGERGPLPELQSTIQPLRDGDIYEVLLRGNFITTSSVVLRREVFERVGGFCEDPILPPAEDWDLWLRVAHDHRAAACRLPVVKYRHHITGASRNVDRMNRARRSVVERGLSLPRGRTLAPAVQRQIWSAMWATNGWDAARHGHKAVALQFYWKSLLAWPTRTKPYVDIVRVLSGRS
jgi:glycosyltransferase involved in cell wall biosynthesis